MRRRLIALLSLIVLLAACGGDGPTNPDNGGGGGGGGGGNLMNGTFNATVNGSAFNAASAAVIFSGGIVGFGAANLQGRSLGFAFFASGPGTYTIAQTVGNNATYTEGSNGWVAGAGIAGSSGSVTFTTLSSTRAVGSFTLTLAPSPGSGASGTRTVAGTFNLAVQSN